MSLAELRRDGPMPLDLRPPGNPGPLLASILFASEVMWELRLLVVSLFAREDETVIVLA